MEGDRSGMLMSNGLDPDLAKAVRTAVEEPIGPEEPTLTRIQKSAHHVVMHTSVGFFMDTAQTLLSLIACVMYVVSTYLEDEGPLPVAVVVFEWLVACAFTFDYLLHLFIAENKLAHASSWGAMVDLLSILPILTVGSNARIGFLRVLRVFRIVRILRGYRSFSTDDSNDADVGVTRQVGMLIFILLSFIFMGAGLIHSVELMKPGTFRFPDSDTCELSHYADALRWEMPPECKMDFFGATYFVCITVTTVGFGDMYPLDNVGRAVVLVVLLPLFLIIPREVSKLSELIERQSKFSKAYSSPLTPHVIVCGHIDYSVAISFLSEYFHEDHGDQKMKVVFLSPEEPHGALENLVSNPLFSEKVQYIRGTPLSTRDLGKAKLQTAQAVFVLTSQFSTDVHHRDVAAVLIVKAIKSITPWTSVYCQLVSPENKVHRRWSDWDHVVCIQELRMGLLAKSALCPGFSTLVSNLIMSSSHIDVESLARDERLWMEEYIHGYGQEVYCMELSPAFSGHLFAVAAHKAFLMFGVCMFGVETQRIRSSNTATGAILAELDEAAAVDEAAGRERQNRLQSVHMRKLGIRSAGEFEESDLEVWRRERAERENAVLLINPKDYIIRAGDKALCIADNYILALHMQEWDGSSFTLPHITPADKTTFRKLNNGRGPLLREAKPRLVPADDIFGNKEDEDHPEQTTDTVTSTSSTDDDDETAVRAKKGVERGIATMRRAPGTLGSGLSDRGSKEEKGVSSGEGEMKEGVIATASTSKPLPATPPRVVGTRDLRTTDSGSSLHSIATPTGPDGTRRHVKMTKTLMRQQSISMAITGRTELTHLEQPIRDKPFGNVDDASNLKGHIVICGAVDDGLEYLIMPLRAESRKPVLILYREGPAPVVPVPPSQLDGVFFMQGNALNLYDLHRAGMEHASCAIILANPAGGAQYGGVRDLEAVFTTCVIEANFRSCRLIVEILDPESLKFMNFNPSRDSIPHALWPQYACGRVYIATALDTLLCQAFYNSALIRVITRVVIGTDAETDIEEAMASSPPLPRHPTSGGYGFASSGVGIPQPPIFSSSSSGAGEGGGGGGASASAVGGEEGIAHPTAVPAGLSGHPMGVTPPEGARATRIVGPGGVMETVEENARVVMLQVPTPYVNRHYKDLFSELVLTKGILPLAVFRSMDVHDAVLPYVVANPNPVMVLHPDDRLFVLCSNSVVKSAAEFKPSDEKEPATRKRADSFVPTIERRKTLAAGLTQSDAMRVAIARTYLNSPANVSGVSHK